MNNPALAHSRFMQCVMKEHQLAICKHASQAYEKLVMLARRTGDKAHFAQIVNLFAANEVSGQGSIKKGRVGDLVARLIETGDELGVGQQCTAALWQYVRKGENRALEIKLRIGIAAKCKEQGRLERLAELLPGLQAARKQLSPQQRLQLCTFEQIAPGFLPDPLQLCRCLEGAQQGIQTSALKDCFVLQMYVGKWLYKKGQILRAGVQFKNAFVNMVETGGAKSRGVSVEGSPIQAGQCFGWACLCWSILSARGQLKAYQSPFKLRQSQLFRNEAEFRLYSQISGILSRGRQTGQLFHHISNLQQIRAEIAIEFQDMTVNLFLKQYSEIGLTIKLDSLLSILERKGVHLTTEALKSRLEARISQGSIGGKLDDPKSLWVLDST